MCSFVSKRVSDPNGFGVCDGFWAGGVIITPKGLTDNVPFKKCFRDSRSERDVSYMDGQFKKLESHSGKIGNFLKYSLTVIENTQKTHLFFHWNHLTKLRKLMCSVGTRGETIGKLMFSA